MKILYQYGIRQQNHSDFGSLTISAILHQIRQTPAYQFSAKTGHGKTSSASGSFDVFVVKYATATTTILFYKKVWFSYFFLIFNHLVNFWRLAEFSLVRDLIASDSFGQVCGAYDGASILSLNHPIILLDDLERNLRLSEDDFRIRVANDILVKRSKIYDGF